MKKLAFRVLTICQSNKGLVLNATIQCDWFAELLAGFLIIISFFGFAPDIEDAVVEVF